MKLHDTVKKSRVFTGQQCMKNSNHCIQTCKILHQFKLVSVSFIYIYMIYPDASTGPSSTHVRHDPWQVSFLWFDSIWQCFGLQHRSAFANTSA